MVEVTRYERLNPLGPAIAPGCRSLIFALIIGGPMIGGGMMAGSGTMMAYGSTKT